MYFVYSTLLAAALILALPFWIVQMLRHGKYREGLSERLGRVPPRLQATADNENCIWIHAVSVGEVLAITGLYAELKTRFKDWRIAVSTTTATGQKLAREKFGAENVFFFPLDFSFALRPYFRALSPRLVVVAETEFWPNFLRQAKKSGARTAIVNARISDRSFPRYRRFRNLLGRVLHDVDIFLAQSRLDQERLIAIGADPARTHFSGNLKFGVLATQELPLVAQLRAALPTDAPVIVCGSTVEGEEALLFDAFKNLLRNRDDAQACLVLAPRHPERFDLVANLLSQRGLGFWRRSSWNGESCAGKVMLLDTIGELASIYSLATFAFVGGSLVPRGGHNILEPAQFGKPILVGPHTENFRDIITIFRADDALRVIAAENVLSEWQKLLAAPAEREALGKRALEVFTAQVGATQRTADALEVLLWMPSSIQGRYQQVQK